MCASKSLERNQNTIDVAIFTIHTCFRLPVSVKFYWILCRIVKAFNLVAVALRWWIFIGFAVIYLKTSTAELRTQSTPNKCYSKEIDGKSKGFAVSLSPHNEFIGMSTDFWNQYRNGIPVSEPFSWFCVHDWYNFGDFIRHPFYVMQLKHVIRFKKGEGISETFRLNDRLYSSQLID